MQWTFGLAVLAFDLQQRETTDLAILGTLADSVSPRTGLQNDSGDETQLFSTEFADLNK